MPTRFGCAVSQDLLASGEVHYGDVLYIPDIGFRIVNDTMAPISTRHVDIMVWSHNEERQIGIRKVNVWVIKHETEK